MDIVIVEDEPVIAQRLQRQVKEILVDQQPNIKWFDNFDDAQSYLFEQPLDLLILDLNLHGVDGFELLKTVSAESFHTIIVSAYAEKAITAFEYGVVDFVAKPFNFERLQQALLRVTGNAQEFRPGKSAKQLMVKKSKGLEIIAVEDVEFIKADGHYTELHLVDKSIHLHDKAIDKIAKILPSQFVRIHRSYIANLERANSISTASGGSYHLVLSSEEAIPISRSRYQQIRDTIGF